MNNKFLVARDSRGFESYIKPTMMSSSSSGYSKIHRNTWVREDPNRKNDTKRIRVGSDQFLVFLMEHRLRFGMWHFRDG